MTDSDLKKLCRLWQKRLRLQNWVVTIRFVDSNGIPTDECGHTDWEDEELVADVSILQGMTDEQTEKAVIHELVHLVLDWWDTGYHFRPKEIAINMMADALYRAYPKRKRKETTNA
jgi:hypothetical protein